jgi:hypothetical protein
MNVTPYHQNTTGQLDYSVNSYSNQMLTQASVSQQQNKDITIFTEDGDKVTISSGQQFQAIYSNYSSFSNKKISGSYHEHSVNQNKSAALKDEMFGYENSRHLSISVDGNLNEQEIKDVRKAIKAIDKIMTKILNGGDINKGLAKALNLVNRNSISGIEANYSYENVISIEHTNVEEISTYTKEGLVNNVTPLVNNEFDYINKLIDEMDNIVKDSNIKPSKIIIPIQKLFSRLLKELSDNEHPNKPKMNLANLIEAELIGKIKQMPEQSKSPINPSTEKLV